IERQGVADRDPGDSSRSAIDVEKREGDLPTRFRLQTVRGLGEKELWLGRPLAPAGTDGGRRENRSEKQREISVNKGSHRRPFLSGRVPPTEVKVRPENEAGGET